MFCGKITSCSFYVQYAICKVQVYKKYDKIVHSNACLGEFFSTLQCLKEFFNIVLRIEDVNVAIEIGHIFF